MNEDDYVMEEPPVPMAAPSARAASPARVSAAAPPSETSGSAKPSKTAGAVKKPTNKRLGRLKKGSADSPAQFEVGKTAGSKSFDPAALAAELKIYWENDGGDCFILQIEEELWSRWPKGAIEKEIRERLLGRVWHQRRDDEALSELDRLLLYVRKNRCVHRMVNALAGYRSGHYDKHGRPFEMGQSMQGGSFIVGTSPHIIKPVKRDWSMMREFIEVRLMRASPGFEAWEAASQQGPAQVTFGWQNQAVMFHSWCKLSYESLAFGKPGSYMGAHFLVLAGPSDCGKSRLQTNVITPLLGGRSADPGPFLTGEDGFNSDMIESEHQELEEMPDASHKTVDRVSFGEAIKKMVAVEKKRVRLMRSDPFTSEPFWRTTLSMNNDRDKMKAFPMLTPDFRDKVLMLLVDQMPLPLPADSLREREAWNARMRQELPGYVWWLMNEFQVPAELLVDEAGKRATRFGFRHWQHPSLASELFDDSPPAQLLEIIDACELTNNGFKWKLWDLHGPHNNLAGRKGREAGSWTPQEGLWTGTAMDLEQWLCGTHKDGWGSTVEREAQKLFKHASVKNMLARLKEERIDRVIQGTATGGRRSDARVWTISRPNNQE